MDLSTQCQVLASIQWITAHNADVKSHMTLGQKEYVTHAFFRLAQHARDEKIKKLAALRIATNGKKNKCFYATVSKIGAAAFLFVRFVRNVRDLSFCPEMVDLSGMSGLSENG